MRPPDSVILTRVPMRDQWLMQTLWSVLMVGGIALLVIGKSAAKPWFIAGGAVLAAAGLFGSVRDWGRRHGQQPALDDARLDELVADRPGEFLVQRELAFGWPLAFSIMSMIFVFIASQERAAPIPLLIAGLVVAACVASWTLALRLRSPFLRFTTQGLMLNDHLIRWSRVAGLRADVRMPLFNNRSRERGQMLVILYEPLSAEELPRGALGRFGFGDNRRELVISLARTRETPAVVYQLAHDFWQRSRELKAP